MLPTQSTFLKKYRRWFEAAGKLLGIMQSWRSFGGGGLVGGLLALGASVEPMLGVLGLTWEKVDVGLLMERGYGFPPGWDYPSQQFAIQLLMGCSTPEETHRFDRVTVRVWAGGDIVVVDEGGTSSELLVSPRVQDFGELLRRITCSGQVGGHMVAGWSEAQGHPTILVPGQRVLKPYYSSRPPYPSDVDTQSLLLAGPTGAGKSLFAKHVADALQQEGGAVKSLTIPGEMLESGEYTLSSVMVMVEVLRPGVVILDDIPADKGVFSRRLLSLTEWLYGRGQRVILTWMTSGEVEEKRGAVFLNGLRPGRVDKVLILHAPDAEGREVLFRSFGLGEDLSRELAVREDLEGLSPAYLEELSRRLLRMRSTGVEQEIQTLLWMCAPVDPAPAEQDHTDAPAQQEHLPRGCTLRRIPSRR